jgi:uncharacterized membrane protein required for colicin V production
MDVVLIIVIVGCGAVGAWWGGVRMASSVVAVIAAVLAGRWAGPTAASLLGAGAPDEPTRRIVATGLIALIAGGLVLLAGRGLRKGLETLKLGWLDRIAGVVIASAIAAALLAVLLGLATLGGHPPTSPFATRLSKIGQAALAVQQLSNSKAKPSSSPSTPIESGQQPTRVPS